MFIEDESQISTKKISERERLTQEHNIYYLKTLNNALNILESFDMHDTVMGVSEISEKVGLHKSVVFRILYTLRKRGYVTQSTKTRKFRLGLKCFEVGSRSVNQMGLGAIIQPIIEKLASQVQDTVNVGVLDGGDIIYVNKIVPQSPLRVDAQIGARFPAHCTALGKAILAFLPANELDNFLSDFPLKRYTEASVTDAETLREALGKIRHQGFVWSEQELFEEIVCIGAPIFDHQNNVIAGISIAMLKHRIQSAKYKEELNLLITRASREVSEAVRHYSLSKEF